MHRAKTEEARSACLRRHAGQGGRPARRRDVAAPVDRQRRLRLPTDREPRRRPGLRPQALVRWRHPTRGCLGRTSSSRSPRNRTNRPPQRLGPAQRVRERELQTLDPMWSKPHDVGQPVGGQVRSTRSGRAIASAQDANLRPEHLQLEMTERPDERRGQHDPILENLRAWVLLGVDDFGTGYSSLAYLKPFRRCPEDRPVVRQRPGRTSRTRPSSPRW